MDLVARVRRTSEDFGLLPFGCTVVVGVSGGPDSVCLLHVLAALRHELSLDIQVAHLHHGSRGEDANADAAFVFGLASGWGLPTVVERMNVPGFARANSIAFEEAARVQRYSFLARVTDAVGASRIAVGHNADDQAETVLMHLLRGAGLSGLRGMLPLAPLSGCRRADAGLSGAHAAHEAVTRPSSTAQPLGQHVEPVLVVRPLLEIPRADIERYCEANHLHPRFDRSNLDTTFFRNRLRHDLLPRMAQLSPRIRERLCHTAAVVAADYELLGPLADRAWTLVAKRQRGGATVLVDKAAWRDLPTALQRATFRRAMFKLRPGLRDLGFVHIEDARRLALAGSTGSMAILPAGTVMVVGYDTLTFRDREDSATEEFAHPYIAHSGSIYVQVPGRTALPGAPWTLVASLLDRWDVAAIRANCDRWTAYFDQERLAPPVLLRPRRQGDVFLPLGMGGHRAKVSSIMIDRKIPREARDHVPLLTAGGRIAWICGHRVAEGAGVHEGTGRVLRLEFQHSPSDGADDMWRALRNGAC